MQLCFAGPFFYLLWFMFFDISAYVAIPPELTVYSETHGPKGSGYVSHSMSPVAKRAARISTLDAQ
jgi:hypothetical protein